MKLTRSEFFSKPAEYLAKAEDDGEPIELLRYSDPVHAIVPFDALEDGYSAVTYIFWAGSYGSLTAKEEDRVRPTDGYAVTIRRFRQAKDQEVGAGMKVNILGQNGAVVQTTVVNYSNRSWESSERAVASDDVQQKEAQA